MVTEWKVDDRAHRYPLGEGAMREIPVSVGDARSPVEHAVGGGWLRALSNPFPEKDDILFPCEWALT